MNREQLAHILRSAATIVDDPNILVIGSQSVLATFDEDELPDAATASMELDPWDTPARPRPEGHVRPRGRFCPGGDGHRVTVIRAEVPVDASGPTVTTASPASIRRVMVRS